VTTIQRLTTAVKLSPRGALSRGTLQSAQTPQYLTTLQYPVVFFRVCSSREVILRRFGFVLIAVTLLLVLAARSTSQDTIAAPTRYFSLTTFSSMSFMSAGLTDLTTGYARIQAAFNNGVGLGGFAIFASRQNGVLISEASVPVQPLISSGRIYAEIAGPVTTGIAIANPNTQPVTINFFFTDANGNDFGQGSTTINPLNEISTFLTNAPFNAPATVHATFTFTSSLLVSAIALRGLTNERAEFLTTTVPVSPVGVQFPTRINIPQFADGAGWTTSIVVVNPSDAVISGELRPFGQSGDPLSITLNGVADTVFNYSIAPRSFRTFQSAGASADVQAGFISIVPISSDSRPSAFALFAYKSNGVTTTEATVIAPQGAPTNLIFVESSGDFAGAVPGSIQSGVAIAYSGAIQEVSLQLSLHTQDGKEVGYTQLQPRRGQWQTTFMLSEVPGLPRIAPPFRGVLYIGALGGTRFTGFPSVSVTGIHARYNERRELLITATPPPEGILNSNSSEFLFPHLAVGGGYETQFVLTTDRDGAGTMYFFDQHGNPLNLPMQ
jgi:hypothetical protein